MPAAIRLFSSRILASVCCPVAVLLGLAWPQASPAADGPTKGVQFACPPVWPGLDGERTRLLDPPYIWHDYFSLQLPNKDGSFDTTQKMQLDCRYEGKRHLTLVIPGNHTTCKIGPLPGVPNVRTLVCTIHTDDPFPGEVIMRPAEPVTEQTDLNGLALRRDRTVIRQVAGRHGYREEADVQSDANPLIFIGPQDRLIVHFAKATQLSRRVELDQPVLSTRSLLEAAALRFGLARDYVKIESSMVNRWPSRDEKITMDWHNYWPKSTSLVLTDHEAGE